MKRNVPALCLMGPDLFRVLLPACCFVAATEARAVEMLQNLVL